MASATAGGGTIDQTPPAATMRSGAGSAGGLRRRLDQACRGPPGRPPCAARPHRRSTSAHGAIRSSRRRSRRRCRSEATVIQPSTRSTVASSGSAGARPAAGTIATSTPAGSDGPGGERRGPEPAVVADLDELDAAIEHVRERHRGRARARVGRRRRAAPARTAGRAGAPRRRRAGPPGRAASRRPGRSRSPNAAAPSAIAPARIDEALRPPGGRGGDEGGQLGQRPALVGPGRVARAGQDAVGARRRAAAGTWPAGRSSRRSPPTVRQPLRGRGRDERRERPFRGGHDGQAPGRRRGRR